MALDSQYLHCNLISDNFVAVSRRPRAVKMTKAYAIGFVVLEMSKYTMFDQWYNVILPHFDGKVKLITTDTGILCSIKNEARWKIAQNAVKYIFQISIYYFQIVTYLKQKQKIWTWLCIIYVTIWISVIMMKNIGSMMTLTKMH